MSSVSGCGGSSASQYQMHVPRAMDAQKSQELFSKLDVNGDNSIDASELKTFTDYVSEKTGATVDSSALMGALDSDGDGNVTSSELTDNAKSLFDALRQQLQGTQGSIQSGAPDADKMFAALDTDGDGSISSDEFKAGMQHRPEGPPPDDGAGKGAGHGGVGRMIASLLEQYGQGTSTVASSAALSIAA